MRSRCRGGVALLALVALVALALARPAPAETPPRPSGPAAPAAAVMPTRVRVALVPLDDRPVCLQYPEMMAGLAHAEVLAPPRAALGRFTTPGDTDAITRWLRAQEWGRIDALIVSTDMLAFGGLVASRGYGVDAETALARLTVLSDIRKAHPKLRLYGFSVIMRLAPTADGSNEAWRESLARYAEIAPAPTGPGEAAEIATLLQQIPTAARQDYLQARARNRRLNLAAVDLAARQVFDYLVVSQDDARPRGMHLADRAAIAARVRGQRLAARVGVQPGADEVAMLLLARAVLEQRGLAPTVGVDFSSVAARTMVAPFEDRPLHETASFQLVAAGASVVPGPARADLQLLVFASRHDAGRPETFARAVEASVARGVPTVVADIDPRGDVQGASPAFTEALLAAKVFPRLHGYASWNTAGNTLGTAIAHGLLAWAGARLATVCSSPDFTAMADARVTFMLHRLVNDYAYQGVLRPVLNRQLRDAGRDAAWLRTHAAEVARGIELELAPKLHRYARQFGDGYVPPAPGPTDLVTDVGVPRDVRVRLPWDRTFEAAITFDVPVSASNVRHPRLPACRTPAP